MEVRNKLAAVAVALFALLLPAFGQAGGTAKRLVVIKVDGLPGWYVEQAIAERNPDTGKSRAPWIEHIFDQQGVRFLNFYTRGISLSVPSWQVLDTGRPTQIHGNAEFDRYTSHVYDYLNFIPFYINYSRGKLADMPSVQVSDEAGIPMLLDWFPRAERYQAFQLNQRAVRFRTLPRVLTTRLSGRPARQLMDEWQAGFSFGQGVYEEMERELVEKLQDPAVRYLDFFSGDFDHQGHLTMDKFSHAAVFEKLARTLGRFFTAIQKSPLAEQTILAVVSYHGMNTV
ncbi:MAG: alkaline phosphatase family protein, partial [Acidobacteria bacterium]|nr:alkaline phosphatase family protein [Acidobacteriota bacterium]